MEAELWIHIAVFSADRTSIACRTPGKHAACTALVAGKIRSARLDGKSICGYGAGRTGAHAGLLAAAVAGMR
ncbi:MAG: hypothetical protein MnENMB40S_23960 [Rhizobiaceae bacterium MnEN-MB40S]|nr:MAG: hypothetical protein MnENMB40S_23960 [Rhizobiaceae bacterium MnEN-MB40S]